MNIDMESVHDAASVRPDSKSVPVIHGFPGLGVVRQLRRNALQFFSETVKRYGDRVELRVLGRLILLITQSRHFIRRCALTNTFSRIRVREWLFPKVSERFRPLTATACSAIAAGT